MAPRTAPVIKHMLQPYDTIAVAGASTAIGKDAHILCRPQQHRAGASPPSIRTLTSCPLTRPYGRSGRSVTNGCAGM